MALSLLVGLMMMAGVQSASASLGAPAADRAVERAEAVPASPPADYTIGPADVLSIVFWRDTELTADVVVRPDGQISLPLLNDIAAAGLTPNQLRVRILDAARRFVADPSATVVVKAINSRNVFITGLVEKPGMYPLHGQLTVLQLIAMAGGLKEFVSGKNIVLVRIEAGKQVQLRFNYEAVVDGKDVEQNRQLRPGDTVIVP